MEKIEVDAREILFFKENAPNSLVSLIMESLSEQGHELNRTQVWRELTTIKKSYLKIVIEEARRLIKAIKGVEYNPGIFHTHDEVNSHNN